MRHDTRKIREENPLIANGLYGGGGGGGGGGDAGDGVSPSAGPGSGPGGPGTGPASNSDVGTVGAANGEGQLGTMMGMTPSQTLGLTSAITSSLGLGLPGLGMVASLGNAINAQTGFSDGTPGIGTGDPGSGSSPGGAYGGGSGMLDASGQYEFIPGRGWVPVGGGGAPAGGGGGISGRAPNGAQEAADWAANGFDPGAYLRANPDVAASGMDPWVHYYTYGVKEGRSPNGGASAGGGGGGAAPAAAPVDPQAQLRQAQLDLVNQQRSIAEQMLQRQNLLQDQLLSQQGLTAVRDANGNVTGYQPTAERSSQLAQENQIASQLRQRTLDALNGNLPVDPALERGLGEQRQTLEAQLRGNLGSGFATSTPGISALADFDKRAEELRSAARHDQLSTAEGLRLAGSQVGTQGNASNLASILGITNAGATPASIFSNAGSGLNASLANLLGQDSLSNAYRIAQLQGNNSASNLQAQLAAQDNAGYGALVGQLGSAFLRSDFGNSALTNLWDSFTSLF